MGTLARHLLNRIAGAADASLDLLAVDDESAILPAYRRTAIGELLRYHNLGESPREYTSAQLLIGMCMDNRKVLHLPDNFAYVLRVGGANMRPIEFKISFAIAVGGVRALALIGHDQCGMASLPARRDEFVAGLVERGGWTRPAAEAHFDRHAPEFAVPSGPIFVWNEARRLQARYPGIIVAPLFYLLDERALYQVTGPEGSVV
jgi:carbonic anhydrase